MHCLQIFAIGSPTIRMMWLGQWVSVTPNLESVLSLRWINVPGVDFPKIQMQIFGIRSPMICTTWLPPVGGIGVHLQFGGLVALFRIQWSYRHEFEFPKSGGGGGGFRLDFFQSTLLTPGWLKRDTLRAWIYKCKNKHIQHTYLTQFNIHHSA